MRVYMMSQFRDQRTMSDLEYTLVLAYARSHLCRRVCLKWRVYMPLGASFFSPFFEDAPLVEFMYPVFSRMPKGIQVSVVVPLFIWALLIPFAR